jgi:pilus assembly protein FimV
MPFKNRKPAHRSAHVRPLLTALAIASGSMTAHALTLGRLQVLSGMGEPLRAEVEIAAATAEESQSLRAQIASSRSFQQAGMEYNPALEGLLASIENRPGGRSFIVLQGRKPVQESFIDLILETQWASGRLVRNYALLLNSVADKAQQAPAPAPVRAALPVLSGPAPAPAPLAAEDKPPRIEYNAQNVPVYRFDQAEVTKPPQPAPAVTAGNDSATPTPALQAGAGQMQERTVTVETGQTASHLALAHMPASVTLEQMLVALQRHNPEAFIEDNVNLLRAGAVLRMPTAEEAQQTSAREARQIVVAQHRDFAAYAQRIAQSPQPTVKPSERESTGKVSTEAQIPPPAGAAQDNLTLSKSQVGKDSKEAKLAAQREAQDAAEQMEALKKNVEELNSLASASPSASEPAVALPEDGKLISKEGLANKPVWIWGAILAALLGVFLWRRHRASPAVDTFAPSYDDEPTAPNPPGQAPDTPVVPPQMAGIDLNLVTPPETAPRVTISPAPTDLDTDAAKLELASVLLSKGDVAIARSLAQSVASNGTGALKDRAQQMLSQFP